MKKLSVVLLLIASPMLLSAQEIVSIKYGEKYDPGQLTSFLNDLYKMNDYVISFRVLPIEKGASTSDYFILTKKGGQLNALNYLGLKRGLRKLNISRDSLLLIWNTFVQNDLFTIRNEKDVPNFCLGKYQIYNSHTYEFVLLNQGTMKTLSYYDPEYYDKACYGMAEREKIINCASVIYDVLQN